VGRRKIRTFERLREEVKANVRVDKDPCAVWCQKAPEFVRYMILDDIVQESNMPSEEPLQALVVACVAKCKRKQVGEAIPNLKGGNW